MRVPDYVAHSARQICIFDRYKTAQAIKSFCSFVPPFDSCVVEILCMNDRGVFMNKLNLLNKKNYDISIRPA